MENYHQGDALNLYITIKEIPKSDIAKKLNITISELNDLFKKDDLEESIYSIIGVKKEEVLKIYKKYV